MNILKFAHCNKEHQKHRLNSHSSEHCINITFTLLHYNSPFTVTALIKIQLVVSCSILNMQSQNCSVHFLLLSVCLVLLLLSLMETQLTRVTF